MSGYRLAHKDDFPQVYDLEDPAPYYQGLRPGDYRIPGVLCAFLLAARDRLARARDKSPLRVLDFGAGYGANGALLRHDVSLDDIYGLYAARSWEPSGGRVHWESDRAFFERRRRCSQPFEIGGVDIACTALRYAMHAGLMDAAFCVDLVQGEPTPELAAWLEEVDLVVETGSVGPILAPACARLLGSTEARPWFLYCPRPDVDWRGLDAVWGEAGYVSQPCTSGPARYRKPLGDAEREDVARLAGSLGIPAEHAFRDGYILVQPHLARPRAQASALPVDALRDLLPRHLL